MMKYIAPLFALGLFPLSANALSCLQPDPAAAFVKATQSPDSYIVLNGRFEFTEPRQTRNDRTVSIASTFHGSGLFPNGFQRIAALPVTLQFECLGPWCGAIPADTPTLLFAKQTARGYVADISPCYGGTFVGPDQDTINQIEACMRGEACTPSMRR